MIDVEASLNHKYPKFAQSLPLLRKPALSLLRSLARERSINAFLDSNRDSRGIEFIERIFDYFNFTYSANSRERRNIPAQGRVVIVANHPIGSLDGLALIHLVSEVRRDVKIVANDMLMAFEPLHELLLPLNNMTGNQKGAVSGYRQSYRAIVQALESDQAVIVFPAGEVSRAGPGGIRDGVWHSGFLHFARKTGAPVLPVFIHAKNSLLFYSASAIYKPLATAMLAREMFNKQSAEIKFRIGEAIPARALASDKLADRFLTKRLKKHLYKIGRNQKAIFVTEKTIAHPEERSVLKRELKTATQIGSTRDQHKILLCSAQDQPAVLREIGRLREQTFRRVGEGTGSRRDLDRFDQHYHHLVLWDEERLTIAGAYRIGEGERIMAEQGLEGFYTAELFRYRTPAAEYLHQSVELGRSFVHPDYWGKASLDYLWQGLGAYLAHNPKVRYVLGPVSMSADYPQELRDLLVYYYQRYYAAPQALAGARQPHFIDPERQAQMNQIFAELDREQGFVRLQEAFASRDCKLPVLFKQYAALYEEGGYQLLAFNVDPNFGNCVDGLFMGDLTKMKASKLKRYLQAA